MPNSVVIIPEPLVTVVVPTHGRPSLLLRALHSVLKQTFDDYEIVVVIDGEDPETEAMLDTLRSTSIRRVVLKECVGGSEARNIGVRAARGVWIALLDDDDEWLPQKLERQLALGNSFDDEKPLVTHRFYYRTGNAPDRVGPGRLPASNTSMLEYIFSPHGGFQTSTFLCTRELLLQVPFQKDLKGLQDIDWLVRVLNATHVTIATHPDILSVYYAPTSRPSVTRSLSWKDRFNWGISNRHLLSPTAYSLFLQQLCLKRAKSDGAGIGVYRSILMESIDNGSASVGFYLRSIGIILLSESARLAIRRWTLVLFKRGRQ